MKKKIINALKIVAFFAIGIALFWLVYRNQDKDAIINALKSADIKWIILSLFLGALSHISRSIRWSLLIEPLGYKPRKINLILSVFIMYLTNMAIPRSGEVVRCGLVSKYEKIPFSKLLGTVISERVVDMIMLFLLGIIVILTQSHVLIDFINNNPTYSEFLTNNSEKYTMYFIILTISAVLFFTLLFIFRKKIKETKIYKKIEEVLMNFKQGLVSIITMKNKFQFFLHTIFIWAMYFLMIYVCFFSFEFTSHLTLLASLSVFVMATIGIVIPSPGGIGTWHFLTIETLFIYGVEKQTNGSAFAIAAHESSLVMILIIGLICFIALPFFNKSFKEETSVVEEVEIEKK